MNKITRVKICGITNIEDAMVAVNAGADVIGVINVKGTPRFVDLKTAEKIFNALPVFISKVVVATPQSIEEALEIEKIGADYIQLHGDEPVDFVTELKEKSKLGVIKKIVVDNNCLENSMTYSKIADAILLDTKVDGLVGGTGKVNDWDIAREVAQSLTKPVILAGGLSPGNVGEAVARVGPYAVDTSSGVESMPARKDKIKVEEFIINAKKFSVKNETT